MTNKWNTSRSLMQFCKHNSMFCIKQSFHWIFCLNLKVSEFFFILVLEYVLIENACETKIFSLNVATYRLMHNYIKVVHHNSKTCFKVRGILLFKLSITIHIIIFAFWGKRKIILQNFFSIQIYMRMYYAIKKFIFIFILILSKLCTWVYNIWIDSF